MNMTRREFAMASAAALVSSMFGISPSSAAEFVNESKNQEPVDGVLTIRVGGTPEAPEIRVIGVLVEPSISVGLDTDDLMVRGKVVRRIVVERTLKIETGQPFNLEFTDEYLSGGDTA